jgi:hypothetical protein
MDDKRQSSQKLSKSLQRLASWQKNIGRNLQFFARKTWGKIGFHNPIF